MKLPKSAKRLAFHDPTFHDGVNMTPRNGDQWLRWWLETDDETVVVIGPNGKPIGTARVTGCAYLPFVNIPADWLILNQCHNGRTHAAAMQQLLLDSPNDYVTLLFFVRN